MGNEGNEGNAERDDRVRSGAEQKDGGAKERKEGEQMRATESRG